MAAFPSLRSDGTSTPRDVARVVNGILAGKLNAILLVEVPAGAASVVVEDARIGAESVILTMPGSSVTGVSAVADGTATVGLIPGPARVERLAVLG